MTVLPHAFSGTPKLLHLDIHAQSPGAAIVLMSSSFYNLPALRYLTLLSAQLSMAHQSFLQCPVLQEFSVTSNEMRIAREPFLAENPRFELTLRPLDNVLTPILSMEEALQSTTPTITIDTTVVAMALQLLATPSSKYSITVGIQEGSPIPSRVLHIRHLLMLVDALYKKNMAFYDSVNAGDTEQPMSFQHRVLSLYS